MISPHFISMIWLNVYGRYCGRARVDHIASLGSLVRAANVTGFDVRDGKAMYSIVVIPGEGKAAELS